MRGVSRLVGDFFGPEIPGGELALWFGQSAILLERKAQGAALPPSNVWPWLALPFALLVLGLALGAREFLEVCAVGHIFIKQEGVWAQPYLASLSPITKIFQNIYVHFLRMGMRSC